MVAVVDAASKALKGVQFDYQFLPISDLVVETSEDKNGRQVVDGLIVNDERLLPSQRFWTSLFARYGFNKAFFKYFNHEETFRRISEVETSDRMRLCVERRDTDNGVVSTLMAVSSPTNPVVVFDDLVDELDKYNGQSISYANGEVYSTHAPRVGAGNFTVAGDTFSNRFVMATPIDGYGKPNFYLSLLRQICENGIIGYAKAFKSALNLGKASDDVLPTITRALDGFGDDEGFASLRQRMESATRSWASVAETQTLYDLIIKLHGTSGLPNQDSMLTNGNQLHGYMLEKAKTSKLLGDAEIACPMLTAYHTMTGDVNETYGIANIDALSLKRQRTLPTKCTMYDLVNFATEAATHYAAPQAARHLQSTTWKERRTILRSSRTS